MNGKKLLSYFYIVIASVMWGFIGVFNRMLGDLGVAMFDRLFIRNFGTLLVLTVTFAIFKPSVFRIKLRHLPIFLGSGIFSMALLGYVYFTCQTMCSLAVAGVLLYLAPTFVVIAGAILWKEPLTKHKVASVAVALLGCALVSGVVGGLGDNEPLGILFGVLSGLCYGSYTIFAHYGMKHYDTPTMLYWTFVVAGLVSFLFFDGPAVAAVFTQPRGILGAAGVILIATALPYYFYTKGLEGVDGGSALVVANVEPVVAALVGIVLYHEQATVWTALGIALVILAAVILARGDKIHGKERG